MAIMEDVESGLNTKQIEVKKPLIQHKKEPKCQESCNENQGCIGVVLFSTAVAVCGSFEFGTCVGYSAPTQSGIINDIGLTLSQVPVFIAEIAPKNLRGGLTTLNQLLICAGSAVAFIVGTFVTWRTLVLIGLIPCLVLLAGLFFIPESPRWLAKVGRQRDSEVALQRLRGKDANISQEAAEIQENIETLQILPKARFQDLFQSKYIRSVIVGVGLMVFQQLGGINGFGFYASNIFISAGFSSGRLGTILFGSIQIPITILGAFLMDRSGRKPLIMVSATGTLIGCFATGVSFYLKGQGMHAEWVPILALAGIIVYIGSFSIGMGAVPWVIMSEIFPINIKGIAGGLVTLVNWFGSWAVSYTFNFLMSWSSAGTFFIFSAASAATILFVARVVPETKGRTLEEIQSSLNPNK
uniref:Sugar transporter ERD6-like 16 isoform X2 n=1 Tax=Elaeis guineensis var. tenera TaxID=51953 RepID=A0A6J0PE74_ELAGV|nr:sugar transporter ERD6-like 16 isoform X2 [Elaeis guineensis]